MMVILKTPIFVCWLIFRLNMKSSSKKTKNNSSGDDVFGNIQNATKSNGSGFLADPFPTSNINASTGLNSGGAYSKVDDFGFTNTQSQPYTTKFSGVGDLIRFFHQLDVENVSNYFGFKIVRWVGHGFKLRNE